MKIVLDTNVLVSGLYPSIRVTPPVVIVDLVTTSRLRVCYSAGILAEYRQVLLRPKFPFTPAAVDTLLAFIRAEGLPVLVRPGSPRCSDPTDQVFYDVAVAGQADCLITGNTRHFPKRTAGGVFVLSPADFLAMHYSEAAGEEDHEMKS